MTIRYTGNGAYGYANSLYMALRESGAAPAEIGRASCRERVCWIV